MTYELLVPYGLDEGGTLVHAKDASARAGYSCPCCGGQLVLKAGEVNAKHFAHRADSNCAGESYEHETAKLLIAKVINDLVDYPQAAKQVTLVCTCDCCTGQFPRLLPRDSFSVALVEERVGLFTCDVVGMKGEDQVLGIEVCNTNPVNRKKADSLAIPWVELGAGAVVEDPYRWAPTQSGKLKAVLCDKCKSFQKKLKLVAAGWNQPLDPYGGYRDPMRADYLAALRNCWSCSAEFLAYWWAGVPFCQSKPPAPVPPTVQYRKSRAYKDAYWANCCPKCGAMDGDNFLFRNLDGKSPFKGLPLQDTEEIKAYRKKQGMGLVQYMLRNF